MRHRDSGQAPNQIGAFRGREPGHGRAPVVADKMHRCHNRIDKTFGVLDEKLQPIGQTPARPGTRRIHALVRGNRPKSSTIQYVCNSYTLTSSFKEALLTTHTLDFPRATELGVN